MTRKIVSSVLFGLGAFLLVAAILSLTWAPGVVKRTPIDTDSKTILTGTGAKLDTSTGEFEERPVKVVSFTKTDSEASTDEVAAWTSTQCAMFDDDGDAPDCLPDTDPDLITASTDVFATERTNALAVNDEDILPPDAEPHEGLINKFPFDTKKQAYPYWNGTLGEALRAEFEGTDEVGGIDVYVFVVTAEDEPIEIAEGVPGTYNNVVTLYVEPKTGTILNQTQDQERFLEDGTQVLSVQAGYDQASVDSFVDDADSNLFLLNLITRVVPLVGIIGGILCLVAGAALLLTSRTRSSSRTRRGKSRDTRAKKTVPTS